MCPCGNGGQQPPGLHQAECCQQVRAGDSVPLFSPGETPLECCAQLWAPQCKADMDLLEGVQGKGHKEGSGPYKQRLSCDYSACGRKSCRGLYQCLNI